MTAPMLRRVSSERPPADRQRRPTDAQWSITVAALCLATFIALRLMLILANGPSALDVWLEDHVRHEHASRALKILEHLASLPGSRKGAMAVTVSVGAWVWFRRRDVRPGILLIAAFTGTTATVALLKKLLVLVWPIEAPGGDAPVRSCRRIQRVRLLCSRCSRSSSPYRDGEICFASRSRRRSSWSARSRFQ